MKKIIIFCLALTSLFTSCEVFDFDLQDNPNKLTPSSADPDFVLNEVQVLLSEATFEFIDETNKIMRYISMNGNYNQIADPAALNSAWSDVYELNENVKILEQYVAENPKFKFHRGAAKILKAYAMATLVDYLGDVPYSEANDPNNFHPKADDDEEIYNNLLAELDLAITDLNNTVTVPSTDLYFGGDNKLWIKLANTIKLKMYLNMGDVDAINTLISEDNLISDASEDFVFKYSTSANTGLDSRHPLFNSVSYTNNDFSSYIGNYFIWLLKDSKTTTDPRLRYYLYRQIGVNPQDDSTGDYLRCEGKPNYDYCYVGDFYWGRDHGDDDSRPADGYKKTTYGVYPIGGAFDEDNFEPANKTTNLGGAGILPIITSSFVDFLKAEAVLSLGANGDAATLLEKGIRASIDKVVNFNPATTSSSFAATSDNIDDYVTAVLDEYNSADDDGKLDIVLREYYIASFGNSIESYNGYRRTGYPSNIQAPIKDENIPFPRTFAIPRDVVTNNSSIDQRPKTTQVFWDKNPAGFIK
ncbi:SusD/RagB family nutrient-binding outer membrane lipoprotein [Tenacibaculum sp. UWU-22]|uniref:SusD/RagB family nutrient-binding outer membrane lipoprotein n=1 Tax=Tenacibaculum sp. UWU-22 TaxID=3234187 RepID=UPI0034DAE5BD